MFLIMTKQADDIEIELKLILPQTQLESVFDVLKKQAVKGKIKDKFRPRDYYDTSDLELSSRMVALRVQHKEKKGYEQTIKAAMDGVDEKSEDGVLARMEWKDLIPENKPDLKLIKSSDAKSTVKGIKNKHLMHIFTASVKRRYFDMSVEMPDGSMAVVELAFDLGDVALAAPYNGTAPVCEIEIEKKSGSVKAIDIVKEQILKMAPDAKVSTISKAATGYQLYAQACCKK